MGLIRASIFTLGQALGPRECSEVIDWAEAAGFAPWPADAAVPAPSRCAVAESLPFDLWIRLAEQVRTTARCGSVRSDVPVFVERFDPGQRLLPELRGVPEGDREGETRLTLVVHLNEGFAGGETACYPADRPLIVTPRAGAGLAFPSFLASEELPVRAGRKYLLRTEVVVRRREGG